MAVLKSWYVMLFFFITKFPYRSFGDETGEIVKSITVLLRLQGLATGLVNQSQKYNHRNCIDMTLEVLQTKIEELYDRLECGYLYSAQFHLKMTRYAIPKLDQKAVTAETAVDLSFDNEAAMMIDSFLDPKPGRLHRLYLVLIHARKIYRSFWYVFKNGTRAMRDTFLDEKKLADDHVLSAIETRLLDGGCAFDNYFNVAYKECKHLHFADEPPTGKGRFWFQGKTARLSVEDAIDAIRRNKQLLRTNFIENRANPHLPSSASSKLLTYGSLWLFRDERSFVRFFDEFSNDKPASGKVQFPVLESERNFTGIDSLATYQRQVIGMLKTIMLDIVLSYTNRLGESEGILADTAKFNDRVFDRFQYLMVLEDDKDFNNVRDTFSSCHGDVESCKSSLGNTIVELIKTFADTNNLPKIKPTDDNRSLNDVLTVGIGFVDKIQKEIGENSIRAVQKFLKIISETETIL